MNPRVLILDEPTRGIDVGAKAEIYRIMAELADAGMTILMVSSDMEEVIGMSDRVVVMHERQIKGILLRLEVTQARIGSMMTGRVESLAAPASIANRAFAVESHDAHGSIHHSSNLGTTDEKDLTA